MSHTIYNKGQQVALSDNIRAKALEMSKDPFWIETLGQETLDRRVEESKMTYTVDVVINEHTGYRIVSLTRPDGTTSLYPDLSLKLVG